MIHKTAVIDNKAKLGKNVKVGPFSVIGPNVEIGDDNEIASHVVITGRTQIGHHNRFYPFSCIGEAPQDLKYADEDTRLVIGDYNLFRENTTLHRGTVQDKGVTTLGNHILMMANSHVAHDCVLGNHVILTNCAAIGGHVVIEDYVICGAMVAVRQFCHLGQHSFLTRGALVAKDVLPYTVIGGTDARVDGLNLVGLKRRGFSELEINAIKKAYKIIFLHGLIVEDAIAQLMPLAKEFSVIQPMIDGLLHSERGITR
ncbi:MAG: lpxA [Gammaproteobacteria bacterium]|nr:lpxA [Gammaproteobacteria bacterium]